MNPLLMTITFLFLMAMLTTTAVKQFVFADYGNRLYTTYLSVSSQTEKTCVKAALDSTRLTVEEDFEPDPKRRTNKESTQPKPIRRCVPLKIDWNRPPDNSRLNFYLIFFEEDKKAPDHCTHYEIAARLMRELYAGCPFFQDLPQAEYRILDMLNAKKEQMKEFAFPDELSSLSLEDPTLQAIFFKMLSGGKEPNGVAYPSLLQFITFDSEYYNEKGQTLKKPGDRKKINLFFASPDLLNAVFADKMLVSQFLQERDKIWQKVFEYERKRKELKDQMPDGYKLSRTQLNSELDRLFKQVFSSRLAETAFYEHLFDFTLGQIGHVLLIQDQRTGVTVREKIPKCKIN